MERRKYTVKDEPPALDAGAFCKLKINLQKLKINLQKLKINLYNLKIKVLKLKNKRLQPENKAFKVENNLSGASKDAIKTAFPPEETLFQ
ncbi:hypothetical protein ACQ0QQ_11450 [Lysinibacillus sphaericus]